MRRSLITGPARAELDAIAAKQARLLPSKIPSFWEMTRERLAERTVFVGARCGKRAALDAMLAAATGAKHRDDGVNDVPVSLEGGGPGFSAGCSAVRRELEWNSRTIYANLFDRWTRKVT